MELKDVYEIWDRFEQSGAAEIALELQGMKLSLKKGNGTGPDEQTDIAESGRSQRTEKKRSAENEAGNPASVADASVESGVSAPLVGVFYQASSPEAAPFVREGDVVHKGDVVGIIEAMKLMNELKSPVDGRVKKILAADGSMVEYGQLLIAIET